MSIRSAMPLPIPAMPRASLPETTADGCARRSAAAFWYAVARKVSFWSFLMAPICSKMEARWSLSLLGAMPSGESGVAPGLAPALLAAAAAAGGVDSESAATLARFLAAAGGDASRSSAVAGGGAVAATGGGAVAATGGGASCSCAAADCLRRMGRVL